MAAGLPTADGRSWYGVHGTIDLCLLSNYTPMHAALHAQGMCLVYADCARLTSQAKPVDEARHPWIHKLAVEPAYSMARLSSSKIKLWDLLRFQALVQYDWELHRPSLQWRQVMLSWCAWMQSPYMPAAPICP